MADEKKVSKRSKPVTVDGVTYESKTAAIVGLAKLGKMTKVEIAKAVGAHYSMVVTTISKAGVENVPAAKRGKPVSEKAEKPAKAKKAKKAKKGKAEKVDAVVGDIPADVKADMVADGVVADEGELLPDVAEGAADEDDPLA